MGMEPYNRIMRLIIGYLLSLMIFSDIAVAEPIQRTNLTFDSKSKFYLTKVAPSSVKSVRPTYYKRWERARINPKIKSPSGLPQFDIPVTYNKKVQKWVRYFQTRGKSSFKKWLSRSSRYKGLMQKTLKDKGLPLDLFYIAMIESGLSSRAISHSKAVGYWQFMKPTAHRYGLHVNWWIDERRDFSKSTFAAASYLGDLYKMFGSWYLTASAYNMGEGRLGRLIKKHKTNNFWKLAQKKDFPRETRDYIPKIIAAMVIAKAPKLYGLKSVYPMTPHQYEFFTVPGGTDLVSLAHFLGINKNELSRLNPELTKGFIPPFVKKHRIRVPKGLVGKVSKYVHRQNM